MKRDAFVETSQVLALSDAVEGAMDAGEGFPAMVMVYGEAGTGKTRAARKLYSQHLGLYVRAMEGMTQAAFLQELCFELGRGRPHGSARCKSALVGQLRDDPRPLFIDEADRLHVSRLEDLRDIHDLTGSPVVLIGEMGLPTQVSARSRINDRIPEAFRVAYGAISVKDIMLYAREAADLALAPEAAKSIETYTKGNFRRVYNALLSLEAAARAARTKEVDADLAGQALGAARARRGR